MQWIVYLFTVCIPFSWYPGSNTRISYTRIRGIARGDTINSVTNLSNCAHEFSCSRFCTFWYLGVRGLSSSISFPKKFAAMRSVCKWGNEFKAVNSPFGRFILRHWFYGGRGCKSTGCRCGAHHHKAQRTERRGEPESRPCSIRRFGKWGQRFRHFNHLTKNWVF